MQHNILLSVYLTLVRLPRIFPGFVSTCPWCMEPELDMKHLFWSFPLVSDLSSLVTDILARITGCADLYSMVSGMLGLFKRRNAVGATNGIIDLALLMFRRMVAMHWKAGLLPRMGHWCAATGRAEALVV